jgi:hypothetical protein
MSAKWWLLLAVIYLIVCDSGIFWFLPIGIFSREKVIAFYCFLTDKAGGIVLAIIMWVLLVDFIQNRKKRRWNDYGD